MPKEWVIPERVMEPMREPLRSYAELIERVAADRVQALAFFGAIATTDFDPAVHTARSVVVMERVDLTVLRRLAEHGARLGKAAIAAPLVMTPAYIRSSLDTFPLELIEIEQQHWMVFGDDPFAALTFEEPHVRLQCERELKAILIGLRQGLLAAAGREKFVGALGMDVAQGLLRTLRGLLWLKGQKDAQPPATVLTEIERIIERKLTGLRTALDTAAHHGWDEFEALYRDVEALGEAADEW